MSSPNPLPVVFLDDGGVLNDNELRAPQWRRFVGEFMPRHLGGTPEGWAEANRAQFPRLWAEIQPRMATFASHADYQREYDLSWIGLMCSHVGVPAPEESEARRIATAAADYITARAESAYPDAVSAIRMLAEAGFQLHTASGTRSFELENILNGMRLRDCFGQLSGPDLVDTMKAGPEYYRRVFARAGVESARAIVIDDSEQACGWAKETGAVAIRLDREGRSLGAEVAPDLATAARWLIDSFGGRTG